MTLRSVALLLLGAALARGEDAPNLTHQLPPAAKVSVDEAIRTAVEWLVKSQNEDGSFGTFTSGRTWEVRAAIPGGLHAFRAASTALCWMGMAGVEHRTEASRAAQAKALA